MSSLAYQALTQARKQLPNDQDIIERAWTIYLKITRYSPGCTKKDFIDWVYIEQSKEVFV